MAQKDKIELRRTTWFVVNIKARKNQKPSVTIYFSILPAKK